MSVRIAASTPTASPADRLAAELIAHIPGPAAVCDLAGRLALANPAWQALTEGRRRAIGGEGLFEAFRAAARVGRAEGRLVIAGREHAADVTRLDGGRILVRLAAAEPVCSSRPDSPLDGAPFAAALIEGEDVLAGRVVACNPAFDELVGANGEGAALRDLVEPGAAFGAPDSATRASPLEVTIRRRPGGAARLFATPRGSGRTLVHLIDMTEHRALQAQLAQRTKMEAVGQLAGGVAHDFNNLLTAMRLCTEDLLQRHPLGDPAYETLSEIRSTVARAADLVRQLLVFSRKATVRRELLDLEGALGDVEVLLRHLLRESVALETRYAADTPQVRMDRSQLETAILNLVVNARDAIGAAPGGRIRLEARRLTPSEAHGLGLETPAGRDCALVEVSDNGPGMSAPTAEKIFDPFFTTKPAGQGTGLGLATVYGIVSQADGAISVTSRPGAGATFRILLPACEPSLRIEADPPAPGPPARRDLSGCGRILLVEDEALVRSVTARLLRARGYDVLEAADGEAALELAREHAGRIDLMISDVIMPGMDGPALLSSVRPFLQGAPVLFISGYAEAEFSDLLEDEANVSFLAKPLDIRSLAEAVKLRLESRRA
jgi:two-component system cell cycle sensor histidine kinase/response regulator CckA